MSVLSGQGVTVLFSTSNPTTGAAQNADVLPTATLHINGVADAAMVTVTNITTGIYTAAVTLPALLAGDVVTLRVAATVATIAAAGVIWQDTCETAAVPGDAMTLTAAYDAAKTAAQAGDAMTLTTGERTSLVSAVWNALTSAMTTVGSIGNLLIEKLALLVAGSVTISAPVLPNGNAKTIQGDDYLLEDGRALEWAISTTADLADAEIAVILGGLTTFEAELVGDNTVRLELTRTETAAIPVGNHDFAVVATQDDGDVITLLEGRWRSTRRIVAP